MGVAGASINSHGIHVTGIAGLLAGACSMGEWISVSSPRELAEREIRIESREVVEIQSPRAKNCSSSTKRRDS
jgi:VIT1/CCC1 family predicted Fe2+/Mn2+ transporter